MKFPGSVRPVDLAAWSVAALVLAIGLSRPADASPADDRQVLQDECGSCHLAYPAKFLSPTDWGQVLGHLDAHYGVDATLDGASLAAIARELRARKAQPSGSATLPRITTSAWFLDEHDDVRADVWRRPAVQSAANCDACHQGTARGDFDEDSVRIPR